MAESPRQGCLQRRSHPTTKPGALAPGICLLSRGAREDVGAGCAKAVHGEQPWLENSLIVRSAGLWLWGGAAGAGTWGQVSIRTFPWIRGT